MIPQTKIEQAAQKYADNNKQLPRDFYGAEIVCKVDFTAGVRFAESEKDSELANKLLDQHKIRVDLEDGCELPEWAVTIISNSNPTNQ